MHGTYTKKDIASYSPYAGIWGSDGGSVRMLLGGDFSVLFEDYENGGWHLTSRGSADISNTGSVEILITAAWDAGAWTTDPGRISDISGPGSLVPLTGTVNGSSVNGCMQLSHDEFYKETGIAGSPYGGYWQNANVMIQVNGNNTFYEEVNYFNGTFEPFALGYISVSGTAVAVTYTDVWDSAANAFVRDDASLAKLKTGSLDGSLTVNGTVTGSAEGSTMAFTVKNTPTQLVKDSGGGELPGGKPGGAPGSSGGTVNVEGQTLTHTNINFHKTNMNQVEEGTLPCFDFVCYSNHSSLIYWFPVEAVNGGYTTVTVYYKAAKLASGLNQYTFGGGPAGANGPVPSSGNGCKIIAINNAEFEGGGPYAGQWDPIAGGGEYTLVPDGAEKTLALPFSLFDNGLKLMLKDSPEADVSDFFSISISKIVFTK